MFRVPLVGVNGGEVDDHAPTLLQRGQHRLRHEVRCAHVHRVQPVELLNGGLRKRAVHGDAGIVDQHVESAEERQRFLR